MPVDALMHGWPGLLGAYAAVQGPLLAGMIRARAPWRRLLLAPVIAAPVTAVSGAALAMLTPALAGFGIASASLAQLSVGIAVSAGLGYLAGRALGGGDGSPTPHLRGAIVVPAVPAARRAPRDPHRGAERTHGALTLAGVALTAEDETKHFKLIGTTGTGKSTAIRELLGAALARGDRAVIADPDGGYLREFYDRTRGDVILNPFEPASVRWDLFGELGEPHDVEQLARSLIPDHEGPDRSWRGYARTFFSAVTDQAHAGGVNDVRELYRLLVVAGTPELRTLVAGTPAQPFLEEHNGRMFDSIRSVTSSAVSALAYVARQKEGAPFSRAALDRAGRAGTGTRRALHPVSRRPDRGAAVDRSPPGCGSAIFEAMNAPEGDQRLWFVIDELDALGQIDGLKDALARLRKFGGRCVLGFQSMAQVSATYGAGEAQTIVENCGGDFDFALLRQRARRHFPICLAPDRGAGGAAQLGVALAPSLRAAARDQPLGEPHGRGGRHGVRDRAAAGPRRLPEARFPAAVAAGVARPPGAGTSAAVPTDGTGAPHRAQSRRIRNGVT